MTIQKKICLLGDMAVGKTSLIRRFIHNVFTEQYTVTIGVNVSRKTVVVTTPQGIVTMTMILWDLSSSESFSVMRESYLRGASGALLVGDLTRPGSFDFLTHYANQMRMINPESKLILAANKIDLLPNQTDIHRYADQFAVKLNAKCYYTSAKTGTAVEEVFRELGRNLAE